jgi:hypothetical protein
MARLVEIEITTGVSLERLAPHREEEVKMMRRWQAASRGGYPEIVMPLSDIIIGDIPYFNSSIQNQRIIIDINHVLISGLTQIQTHKINGDSKVLVVRLDLETLLLRLRKLQSIDLALDDDEKVAIGQHLEKMLGDRQGQRNDLGPQPVKNKAINSSQVSLLRSTCYEVNGRTDEYIAELVGFGSKDSYVRAKRVCLKGISELIAAMKVKKISIANAAKLAKLPTDQQCEQLQKLGHLAQDNANE